MRRIRTSLGWLLLLLLLLAGCESSTESDSTPPEISFATLFDYAVVDATFIVELNASDNESVDRVLFELDGVLDSELTDFQAPFTATIDWGDRVVGESMQLRAIAYDDAGNSTPTDAITVYREWLEVASDSDDEFDRNLYRLLSRCDGDYLDFRVEVYGTWVDPYSMEGGVNCAIFVDSDRDAATGLSTTSDYYYAPGDLGADYGAFAGLEGDAIYEWNNDQTYWDSPTAYHDFYLPENANMFEVSISLADIDNPQIIGLVVGWDALNEGTSRADWLPDSQSLSLPIGVNYIPSSGTEQKQARISATPPAGERRGFFWRR